MGVLELVKLHRVQTVLLLFVITFFVVIIKFETGQSRGVTKYIYDHKSSWGHLARGVDSSTDVAVLLDKPEDMLKRQNIMISAETRSGTSFLLSALQRAENTFTVFEPLWPLRMFQMADDVVLGVLHAFLDCNFTSTPGRVFLREMIKPDKIRFFASRDRFPISMNTLVKYLSSNLTSFEIVEKLQQEMDSECVKNDHSILKVIDGRLSFGMKKTLFLTQDSSRSVTRIIHIVRDPRAVISSRVKLGWYHGPEDPEKLEPRVRDSCKRALANYRLCKQYQESMPTRYLCIQYEELSAKPEKMLKQVFDFAKLTYNQEQFKIWIRNHTKSESSFSEGTGRFAFDLTRNSKENIERWKFTSSVALTRMVEKNCQSLLDELGLEMS